MNKMLFALEEKDLEMISGGMKSSHKESEEEKKEMIDMQGSPIIINGRHDFKTEYCGLWKNVFTGIKGSFGESWSTSGNAARVAFVGTNVAGVGVCAGVLAGVTTGVVYGVKAIKKRLGK